MPDAQEKPSEAKPTKQSFRKQIWSHITKNKLATFPLSVHSRIPNFIGAEEAAQRLQDLEEFKQAKIIKVNPDKPQEPVRSLALEAGKEILVPTPRLKAGPFHRVTPPKDATGEELKKIAKRRGLLDFGKPTGLDLNITVDLVVIGSVCVSRTGRRIGKGEGFADLEFAIMLRMGMIEESTTVITMVHDCQVVDDLPAELFEKFDVPVDVIVTPTQTIVVSERLKKPEGIYWDILSPRRVKSMQVLQELQQMDEKEGKAVVLKEVDEKESKKREGRSNVRQQLRRRVREPEGGGDNEGAALNGKENSGEEGARKEKPRRRKSMKPRAKMNIDFSLKLSNIKSHVRVRHLKNALLERGVRASDIAWHGRRGYCYLHFSKPRYKYAQPDQPVQLDSIVANLQQLRLGGLEDDDEKTDDKDEFILVEPAKPITRIEITDVTAV